MKNKIRSAAKFYDQLAALYKSIYPDWEKSVTDHARILDDIIRQHFPYNTGNILDAACGIGTQLIGLAGLGYQMTGTDISPKELEVARKELNKRNLEAELYNCDFKDLDSSFESLKFDLVIALDNAIPHLLSDAEILEAFKAMYWVCRQGIIISVRDYDQVDKSKIQMIPYGYRRIDSKNWFLFQRWEFEGEIISVSFFFLENDETMEIAPLTGRVFRTELYAIGIEKLMKLIKKAGFKSSQCIENPFIQPVIVAKK
jgi:SAM-dependent methyltransferase